MLTVKQVFELARDGSLWQQNLCIKCGDLSGTKKAIQTTAEIQYVIEDLDKKENYIASSNPATETAVLFALNLKDRQVQELKVQHARPETTPEYVVKVQFHDPQRASYDNRRMSFTTLEEANAEFLKWKNMSYANRDLGGKWQVTILLLKKLDDGKYQQMDKVSPETWKPKQEPVQLYQVRIIHLTGDKQVLRFPILAAAEATLEVLKYELKVGRIRGASIIKVIPNVCMRQTIATIGEEEDSEECF